MYNKADIVFKIGTILSFFLLGIDNVSFFNSIIPIGTYNIHLSYIKDFFVFAIFIAIIWSLVYCFKAFKSGHIDLFFQNNKGRIKWIFCNNSNHKIQIKQIIFSGKKDDDGEILDCYWLIPSNEVLSPAIQIQKKIILDTIIIIYQFNDNDPNYCLVRELTKKEIKMFEKLSLSQKLIWQGQ